MTPDEIRDFIDRLKHTRNYLTHWDESRTDQSKVWKPGSELAIATLRWLQPLVKGIDLRDLGRPDSELRALFR